MSCSLSLPATSFPVERDVAGKVIAAAACSRCAPEPITVKTRTCVACTLEHPMHRFPILAPSGKQRRICDLCLATVDSMLKEHASIRSISAATHLSRPAVRARRDEIGVEPSAGESSTLPALIAAIAAECADADDLTGVVATRAGISRRQARKVLRDQGTLEHVDRFAPVDADTLARVAAFISDEVPYAEIARTVGISKETVARHFPGRGRTNEHRAMIAWVAHQNRHVQELHRELYRSVPLAPAEQ